jgi:hypothetical protein
MAFCRSCLKKARANSDYLGAEDKQAVKQADCMVHPTMSNWRVWRTLKTIQYFAAQPDGFKDKRCPTPITLGEGWVHRRNAEVILFDYERYFIDFAIENKLLEQDSRGGVARAVRLTNVGNVALFERVKEGSGQK